MIINDELEGACKEAVVTCFKGLFKLLLKVRYIAFGTLTVLFSCTDYVRKIIMNFYEFSINHSWPIPMYFLRIRPEGG
jgi:hypothetical protein